MRGDVVEIFPAYEDERALRVEFFGDEIEAIAEIDPLRGVVLARPKQAMIFPASHYVTDENAARARSGHPRGAAGAARSAAQGKLLEAQRLEQRTLYDLEMMEEMGFCHGIENYSRYLDGRAPGQPPVTLFDYFPKDSRDGRREPRPSRRSAACTAATARARRRWSSTASGCLRRSTTGR